MAQLFAGIKSRPLYTGVMVDRAAARHLWLVEGGGAEKVKAILTPSEPALLSTSEILVTGAGAAQTTHHFNKMMLNLCHHMASVESLQTRLAVLLTKASMGLRLYSLGSEDFIGAIAATAQKQGVDFDSLRTEQCDSLARRVQCVHCKGMMERVTTNIVPCPHCGLTLFVRDHYSRRLGAFQGVCVNAEDPSVIPPSERVYP